MSWIRLRKGNFGLGAAPDFARRAGLFRRAPNQLMFGAEVIWINQRRNRLNTF
jgi:hypothetical protein